jgi:hypothetical protein
MPDQMAELSKKLMPEVEKIYLLFEKNGKEDPIISIICCGLMT